MKYYYDLSVLMLSHDQAASYVAQAIESVKDIAKEFILIDTGKHGKSGKIAKALIPNARVYFIPFTNFGDLLNRGIAKCNSKWIFVLDSDEWIAPEEKMFFYVPLMQNVVDVYTIPRKHWYDLKRTKWCISCYPNAQARLFRNNGEIRYTNYVHCGIVGFKKMSQLKNGLNIHHFTFVFALNEQEERLALYDKLIKKQRKDEKKK